MNVETILSIKGADVATIDKDSSLADAAAGMRDHRVGALVVSDDGRHIDGIVSERDLVRAFADHGSGALGRSVRSVMSTAVVTCGAKDSVDALMATMTERRIRHLPVVDGEGLLTGIISIGDVVKARVGELELDNQALVDYLHQGR